MKGRLLAGACQLVFVLNAWGAAPLAARAADAPSNAATAVSGVVVQGEAVTTAPRVVPLTAAYSQSTITVDDVKNLSPQESLQTMLSSQPSIFTFENGPNGVGANIFFRAFNSGQFAETFDGVAINDMFNGGVTGQASTFTSVLFIPANVDSVILTRGINNPAVNSYNSLGGTVNFLPRRPSDEFGGSLGGSYGSFNSYTTQASLDTGDFHGLKQLFQFDHRESDGWLANTQDRNTNAYYSATYDAPNGNKLSVVAVYDRNDGHRPFDMPLPLLKQDGGFYQYPLNVANEKAKDTQYMVIVGYKAALSSQIQFENKVFAGGQNYLRTSYANPADSNSPYELPSQAETYDYWIYFPYGPTYNPKSVFGSKTAGNAYHFYGYTSYAFGDTPTVTVSLPRNTITTGGNITYGQLHSREYWYGDYDVPQIPGYNDAWDEHDRRLFVSAYAQDEIKLLHDAVTITPGVKYQYANTIDTDDIAFFYPYGGTVRDSESFVSPTVGLNYKASERLSFNFAFGQNIKFPDISAYYNAVPGTTASTPLTPPPIKIKPEHVNDFELGARYQAGGFSAAVDLYREDFTDVFIDAFNPATYNTIVTNGGSARYEGAEIQLSDDVRLDRWGDLRGYFNYAYNDAEFTSRFEADSIGSILSAGSSGSTPVTVTPGEPMADVPQILITAGLAWSYAGFRFDAQGRYVGHQYILDNDSGTPATTTIHGYYLMDVGLAKTVPLKTAGPWAKSVKFAIKVNNLFDKYYYNEAYVQSNIQGHTVYAGPTEFAAPGAPRSVIGQIEVAF
jgi:outer membrane receptor protein involved in Fe transport